MAEISNWAYTVVSICIPHVSDNAYYINMEYGNNILNVLIMRLAKGNLYIYTACHFLSFRCQIPAKLLVSVCHLRFNVSKGAIAMYNMQALKNNLQNTST